MPSLLRECSVTFSNFFLYYLQVLHLSRINFDSEMMDQANKVVSELMANPVNIGLVGLILFLVYKIARGRKEPTGPVPEPPLAKMKSQDFTLEQLREFDGTGPEGRVLMAVNGKVFDVTRGKNFYGPSKYL